MDPGGLLEGRFWTFVPNAETFRTPGIVAANNIKPLPLKGFDLRNALIIRGRDSL